MKRKNIMKPIKNIIVRIVEKVNMFLKKQFGIVKYVDQLFVIIAKATKHADLNISQNIHFKQKITFGKNTDVFNAKLFNKFNKVAIAQGVFNLVLPNIFLFAGPL